MNQAELLAYVQQAFPTELRLMQTGGYATACPELTAAEKAVVYYYTHTGSQKINLPLYQNGGKLDAPLSQGLALALSKLPAYRGQVYSAAHWEPSELLELQLRAASGRPFGLKRWPAFLSASCSQVVARQHLNYSPKNCLLFMLAKTGRQVERLSHHGPNGIDPFDNEQEVVFLPSTNFRVVAVRQTTSFPEIELLEL